MLRWNALLAWVKVRLWRLLGGGFALFAVLFALKLNKLRLMRFFRHLLIKYRCWRLWKRISAGQLEGRECISTCQKLNSELLALAGFRVSPSRDLLEKGELFPKEATVLRQDYSFVAQAAFDLWYSPHPPADDVVAQVQEATLRFRESIKNAFEKKKIRV